MRRALLAAAVALPVTTLAAQAAGSGQVIEVTNYNASAIPPVSYVNAAACKSGGTASLEWNVVTVSGGFSATGDYQIFASDTQPATSGTIVGQCPPDAPTANPAVHTKQVDSASVTASIQDKAVSGSAMASAANLSCDAASESRVVWVCAHQVSNGTVVGHASGKFIIQVAAPNAPRLDSVGSGDGELTANFTAPVDPGTQIDHYAARATPSGQTSPEFWSPNSTGGSATISGLANNTAYDVVVFAYSVGGNPGPASNQMSGTPVPAADFWEVYKDHGGVEKGGCGTGAAAAPALLGAIALLALRRRAP